MNSFKPNNSIRFASTIAGVALAACLTTAAVAEPPQYSFNVLGPASFVQDMNETGTIVGWVLWLPQSDNTAVKTDGNLIPGTTRAFVVGPRQAYHVLPLPDGYESARAYSINDDGLIVGVAGRSPIFDFDQAVLWTPNRLNGYDVQMLDQLPGHARSMATAINNARQIVGVSFEPVTDEPITVWFNAPEAPMDIAQFGAPLYPQDINDRGVLVGMSPTLFDLNSLEKINLPPFKGLPPNFEGFGINYDGDVVGRLTLDDTISYAAHLTKLSEWELMGPLSFAAMSTAFDINDNGIIALETAFPGEYDFTLALNFPEFGLYPLPDLVAPEQMKSWMFYTGRNMVINNSGRVATIVINPVTRDSELAVLEPIIIGDGDFNGLVDVFDLMLVLQQWGPCGPGCTTDFDGNGVVDLDDLFIVLQNWS